MGEVVEFNRDKYLDVKHFIAMLKFLTALAISDSRSVSQQNINLRLPDKNTTDRELIAAVNNSNESQWRLKPSYYHALVAEMRDRNLLPKK